MKTVVVFLDADEFPYQLVEMMNRNEKETGVTFLKYGTAVCGRHWDAVVLTGPLTKSTQNEYAKHVAMCRAKNKAGVIDLRY